MAVYVVAQLRFTNETLYRRYQGRFAEIFAGSGGRLLAADEAPSVLEGRWDQNKLVLMQFDTADSARAFLESPRYQEISQDRRAGADTVALLARGI